IRIDKIKTARRFFEDNQESLCPNLDLVQAKAFLNEFQDSTNEVVKIFSQIVDNIQFKYNDLLLSGILDIQYIEVYHKDLKNEYQSAGIWNELNENIQIQDLPDDLKKFIEEYILNQETEISKKINSKDKLLFRAT
ncbi:5886_t:CDS:2, partial [Racocetra persica]